MCQECYSYDSETLAVNEEDMVKLERNDMMMIRQWRSDVARRPGATENFSAPQKNNLRFDENDMGTD